MISRKVFWTALVSERLAKCGREAKFDSPTRSWDVRSLSCRRITALLWINAGRICCTWWSILPSSSQYFLTVIVSPGFERSSWITDYRLPKSYHRLLLVEASFGRILGKFDSATAMDVSRYRRVSTFRPRLQLGQGMGHFCCAKEEQRISKTIDCHAVHVEPICPAGPNGRRLLNKEY